MNLLPTRLNYLSNLAEELVDLNQQCSFSDVAFNNKEIIQDGFNKCKLGANEAMLKTQNIIEKVESKEKMHESLKVFIFCKFYLNI